MTEQEWLSATDEERNAEFEKCKDPIYFYNTYYQSADGTKPPPITKEKWDETMNQIEYLKNLRFKRLRR